MIDYGDVDPGMDAGLYTFVLVIPPNFQRDVLAGRSPAVQLNVDATRMSQAFTGSGYIQQIFTGESTSSSSVTAAPTRHPWIWPCAHALQPHARQGLVRLGDADHQPHHLLSIILTGAALIREREHGTIEHLLVMPVTPAEIMLSKVWSMALVVLIASFLSLILMVRGVLGVPIEGSIALFFAGAALHLFATTSMGIFIATLARNMPQFGMLMMLTIMPLQMLSGGTTPRESMPEIVQNIMLVAPTTHFVELSQAILYRGAGLETVWQPFLALALIRCCFSCRCTLSQNDRPDGLIV
jgi:ABC-2 type transport system permease protein